MVYQSYAYEAFAGVLINKGKWHLFQGNRGRKAKVEGNRDNTREHEYKKTKFEGTEEQANLFQRNKETCTPLRDITYATECQQSNGIQY